MPKPRTKRKTLNMKLSETLPGTHNHVFLQYEDWEVPLVTSLLLAGESIAATCATQTGQNPGAPHASPEDQSVLPRVEDFEGLLPILDQVRAWLDADPNRDWLLRQLCTAFGGGDLLRLLFRNLFPGQSKPPTRLLGKQALLSPREIVVLREAAGDRSNAEIGARLGISVRTINRHMQNIYRKLDVNRPMQAVARAISMGYLEMDAMQLIQECSRCNVRNFTPFDTLMTYPEGRHQKFAATGLNRLAAFGLLLLVASGVATFPLDLLEDVTNGPRGKLCRIGSDGTILQTIEADWMVGMHGLAIAPPEAAAQGFAPGHLYLSTELPIQGLNSRAIVEMTPTGERVRCFCGGKDLRTRLDGRVHLAFTLDGRLLATCDSALLCFSQGGASVARFGFGCSGGVCVDTEGEVYRTHVSSLGCSVQVYASDGQWLCSVGGTQPGINYSGIAVNGQKEVFVGRSEAERSYIEVYDPDNHIMQEFDVPGFTSGALALDAEERLIVPCARANDVKIMSAAGNHWKWKSLDLKGKLIPHSVAVAEDGALWVYGSAGPTTGD